MGSAVLVHRLRCPVTRGILVPGPEIKSMSPALAGRFLTTLDHWGSPTQKYLILMISNKIFKIDHIKNSCCLVITKFFSFVFCKFYSLHFYIKDSVHLELSFSL